MYKNMRAIARIIVTDATDKSPEQVKKSMQVCLTYLASKGMLGKWRELERHIHEAWREAHGISKITIASAHPLSVQTLESIEALAHGAEINQVVDERLMGGALIRLDDRRIDGTVLGALTRLKQTLLADS